MSQPLIIAYHLIWTGYGWWLPNDPRGSGSHTIRRDILAELGEIHFGRKRIQPSHAEVREFQTRAQELLKHERRLFDEPAWEHIVDAFAQTIAAERYTCYGCAIMPDHVHLLIRKHKHQAEEMIDRFRDSSRRQLSQAGWCEATHPVWTAGSGWKVFLDHPQDVRRTLAYIEMNPLPLGLPRQHWPFMTEYDDWPLHPGHSPNSPYVKALRAAGRYP